MCNMAEENKQYNIIISVSCLTQYYAGVNNTLLSSLADASVQMHHNSYAVYLSGLISLFTNSTLVTSAQ